MINVSRRKNNAKIMHKQLAIKCESIWEFIQY